VEQVPAISYVAEAGVHGRFLYVSPQAKTILGYQPEDCLSDPHFWWDHLNPEDYPVAMEENTWEEGRPFQVEYRMRRQDGREVWLRDDAIIVRDPATGQRLTRGLLIDITERKGAEDALRRSEETYRMFVTQSAEGIYRTEHEPPVPLNLPLDEQIALSLKSGYIAECNDAMARMYGYKEARELIGARLSALLIADDPVTKEFMVEFLRPGYRITNWESHERDARGQTKIFRNSMIGIVEDGKLARTWGIQRDVTEQMHLEEQLRNAQQLEAIGRLAGGVAHDFNNILSIIMGHGELLLATAGLDDEGRNGVKQIRRAAERAAQLTQQLLAFSRKQVLQPKVLDLNDAVAEVQKMLARVIGEDVELGMKLHSALAPVKADPGQVEQVLMNLAINARDAMPHGGRLTMETSNMEMGSEQAREMGLANGRYVMLKVTDTGHGMDATTMSHIFEPFFTTKPVGKGTGLGLATVYGIVKQSGGGIRVESEVGRGAEFQIFLPAVQIENRNGSATKAGEKVGGGTETILLVEDEPDLRELARIFLEAYGYQVLEAESAEQAIELADGYPAPIHLLLTDVIMPGLSGRQLAESLLGKRADIRVVYMTGYTDDMVVQHKVLEPGVKLLQKPFTKSDLALKVRSTLDGK
jgi:two-component system, cell cycle sensor histidine kinase and response regulator CckA